MNDYVVYCHLDGEGVVRYVGSGKKRRVRERGCRNREWNKIFGNQPLISVILASGLTILQARKIEMDYILAFKGLVVNVILDTSLAKKIPSGILKLVTYSEDSPSGLIYRESNGGTGANKRFAGDIAGYKVTSRGKSYWRIKFKQDSFPVHRIIFYIHNLDFDQSLVIDHLDNNGLNNNIDNLGAVTFKDNCRDREGGSGESGVVQYKRNDVLVGYSVQVTENSRRYFTVATYGSLVAALNAAKNFKDLINE